MPTNLKFLIVLLSSFILLIAFSQKSLAQFPGMGAVNAHIDRQIMNQQSQMQLDLSRNWLTSVGTGDVYEVTFKDSSTKKIVSYMYADTVSHKNFLVFVNKKFPKSDTVHRNQKIYPNQTLYITNVVGFNGSGNSYGVPVDSCWRFKVVSGRISLYSRYAELSEQEFTPSTVIAFQLKDDPAIKYTEAALGKVLETDSNAITQFNKKKYYKAVKKFNNDAEKLPE